MTPVGAAEPGATPARGMANRSPTTSGKPQMLLSDRRRHACSADQTRHATAPDHAATPTPTAAPHTLKSAKVEKGGSLSIPG